MKEENGDEGKAKKGVEERKKKLIQKWNEKEEKNMSVKKKRGSKGSEEE